MYEPAWYVWTMVLLAVFGFAISIGLVVYRGGLAAHLERKRAREVGIAGVAVMLGWIGVNWALAGSGVYQRSPENPIPSILLALVAAIIGLFWSAGRDPVATALDSDGSLMRLALPHTWRVFGGVFLVAMADGGLPPVFAIPAGVGDMAVGVAAPVVAWQLARGRGTRGALWFNVLGALDLVMALTLGLLAAPGVLQLIEASPSTAAVSVLPLALIPSVAVPTAIALHVLSLRRLLGRSLAAGDPASSGGPVSVYSRSG